jgi:hypothetical protein
MHETTAYIRPKVVGPLFKHRASRSYFCNCVYCYFSTVIKCNEDCIPLFYLSHFLLWYLELLSPTDITIMCLYKIFSRLGCTCNTGIQCFMNFCLQHWQIKESFCWCLVGPGVDSTWNMSSLFTLMTTLI